MSELPADGAAEIAATRRWVEQLVVGENLCPFAGRELTGGRVHFAFTPVDDEDALLLALGEEIQALLADPARETTLLIHPHALTRFDDYNQFLDRADALLEGLALDGVFQIASFHPLYRFDGAGLHAAENYSNRSPFPMLHLLREESVARAVDSHPDVDAIPARNIEHLQAIGTSALAARLDACRKPIN